LISQRLRDHNRGPQCRCGGRGGRLDRSDNFLVVLLDNAQGRVALGRDGELRKPDPPIADRRRSARRTNQVLI